MSGLTLEGMESKFNELGIKIDSFIAAKTANDEKTDKEKEAAIKKAEDEKKENDNKEARAKLASAIKKAEEEPDDEKKDAAIKQAMSDYGDDDKKKEGKKGMSEDEKKHEGHIASIILDKKIEIDNKILQASSMINPAGLPALKAELEKGDYTASVKTMEIMKKSFGEGIFQANVQQQQTITQPPPFFIAGAMNPAEVDSSTLSASSSVMDFAKLSTKDLLERKA